MKFFVALLLVGLAVASPLKPLNDAFLQEHAPKFLFTEVTEKNDNLKFVEQSDLSRTVGFCLRNFQSTGIGAAGSCMAQMWKDRKATPLFLKNFLKKSLGDVKDDVDITVSLSDDSDVTDDPTTHDAKWTGSGTLTVQGTAIPFTRVGQLKFAKNRITFEEASQVKEDNLNGGGAIYIDVDVFSKKDGDNEIIVASVSVHHGAGATVNNADGSVTEIAASGQATLNFGVYIQKKSDTEYDIINQGTGTGSGVAHVHTHSKDGDTHVITSDSQASDIDDTASVKIATGSVEITATQSINTALHAYAVVPTVRVYTVALVDKTVTVAGTADKFSVTGADKITAKAVVGDYDDNEIATVDTTGDVATQVDVAVASDKSSDTTVSVKGSTTGTFTPAKGTAVKISSDFTFDAEATSKSTGDNAESVHVDAKLHITAKEA